jgi:hypothetical protein
MDMAQGSLKRTDETIPGLWRFYEEHASQARQHETLRATVTSILSAIAAAVVSLASLGGLDKADIPAGTIVIVLALLGVALSLKHYERNRLHTKILEAIRDEITRLDQDQTAIPRSTQKIRGEAEKEHNSNFAVLENQEKSHQVTLGEGPAAHSMARTASSYRSRGRANHRVGRCWRDASAIVDSVAGDGRDHDYAMARLPRNILDRATVSRSTMGEFPLIRVTSSSPWSGGQYASSGTGGEVAFCLATASDRPPSSSTCRSRVDCPGPRTAEQSKV